MEEKASKKADKKNARSKRSRASIALDNDGDSLVSNKEGKDGGVAEGDTENNTVATISSSESSDDDLDKDGDGDGEGNGDGEVTKQVLVAGGGGGGESVGRSGAGRAWLKSRAAKAAGRGGRTGRVEGIGESSRAGFGDLYWICILYLSYILRIPMQQLNHSYYIL